MSFATDSITSREELFGMIEAQAFLAFDSGAPDGGKLSFPPVTVHDIPFDGIGCHYGIDRTLYYDLYSDGRKIISMNDWRLEEFLSDVSTPDLRRIHDGIVGGLEKKAGKAKEESRKLSLTPQQPNQKPVKGRGPKR